MSADSRHVVVGYHGTDEANAASILTKGFQPGKEDSWVGSAIYFWEKDRHLAFHWCRQRGYVPAAVIAAEIEHSPRLLDLVTHEGNAAYKVFVQKFKQDQRKLQQLSDWIQKNGDQFCDTYFIQLMFKIGVILGVRFAAMASDEALYKKPRTFVYVKKETDKYRSRFVTNIRIILALKDSALIISKNRCTDDGT